MQPRHRVAARSGSSSAGNDANNDADTSSNVASRTASNSPKRQRGIPRSKLSRLSYAIPFLVLGALLKVLLHHDNSTPPFATHQQQQQNQHTSPAAFAIRSVKQEFHERYGGKEAAEGMLENAVDSFGSQQVTARRMVRAAAQKRPFVVAFAGYSVTVGRGNYFQQSFPFCMERILQPVFERIGIPLEVKNAAIGGIPSFPYGWCLEHFMGSDADVISWDYGMNEGNGASAMESYLRHGLQLPKRPMFLLLDSNRQRKSLLQKYANLGLVRDAVSVSRAQGVVDQALLDSPNEENKPVGLRQWNEFGAPQGCPGRSPWHPKKMEHEWIGWMIAMHFLEALEQALKIMETDPNWKQSFGTDEELENVSFPAPLVQPPRNPESVTQLMYGHENGNDQYMLKDVSCRTSFLPASDSESVLPSVVVSGMAETDQDMMQERDNALYQKGWVLDVSKVERDTKKKVQKCGGLGYIDMKVALYGIPESGTLRLWLPYEGTLENKNTDAARDWFDDLIVCEANEKRDEDACQLDKDIEYVVGGVKVTNNAVSSIDGAGVYLKRRTCYNVGIPELAKITKLANVKTTDGADLSPEVRSRLGHGSSDQVGLLIDISIPGADVSRANGACCVSHIIWEQH